MTAPRSSRALLFAGLCAFWAGLALATLQFPGAFDWRYMTVSNLFSIKHNPSGYLWGATGVACCGVLGLSSVVYSRVSAARNEVRDYVPASGFLILGFCFMTLAALIPARWLPTKGHDWLAVIAFLALCTGLVHGATSALLHSKLSSSGHRKLRAIALAGAALWPVAGAALSQLYLAFFRPELPWVTLAWRAAGIPLILSFALWEWLTCVSLSVCVAVLALVPATRCPQCSASQ